MPIFTNFKAVDEISNPTLSEQLRLNLITFFNWSFLEIGAFTNVEIPSSGAYGGDFHILQPVQNPYYADGQVWQGVHDEWVYESGLERTEQPINISGVYVDDTFYPNSTTGPFEHYVNYPNGQVFFNTAIDTASEVKMEYSFREVSVVDADSVPFFQRFQPNSHNPAHEHFNQVGSGDWDVMRENAISLPCVAIDLISADSKPYALGGSSKYQTARVSFNIFSENPAWSNRIAEILDSQEHKTIHTFDLERMIDDNQVILDYRGTVTSGTMTYPELVQPSGEGGYRDKKIRFVDSNIQYSNKIHKNLYHAVTNMELEVIIPNI